LSQSRVILAEPEPQGDAVPAPTTPVPMLMFIRKKCSSAGMGAGAEAALNILKQQQNYATPNQCCFTQRKLHWSAKYKVSMNSIILAEPWQRDS
jgi:hypothetical protein